MIQASEKLDHLVDDSSATDKAKKPENKVTRPKPPKEKKTLPIPNVHHELDGLSKGDRCPECLIGTLYKYEPAQLLRITGHTPYSPELHLSERLRCNACGQFFTATLSDEVMADGKANQKYGYSARSLMALNKYFMGTPFYRQESLQDILGFSITASTVFDQCEYLANDLLPIFNAYIDAAANAQHFHLDDTTHRILNQKAVKKKKRHSDKLQIRTGLYTSGIIANSDGHDVVLFQTNIGHAGEFLDEILAKRQLDRPPPILMSDALSSNNPTGMQTHQGACNAHGRRQFVDVIIQFPNEVEWVLQRYKGIWINEDLVVEKAMTAAQRLTYHAERSLPIMNEIRDWGAQQFATDAVEENSGLGKAIAYFERHFTRLTLFCHIEGAAIDNNKMEAMLKLIVRNRKNAYFYKTLSGAAISDVITSCIATTMKAGINVFEYFNAVQRNSQDVKDNPLKWLPWNYRKKIDA